MLYGVLIFRNFERRYYKTGSEDIEKIFFDVCGANSVLLACDLLYPFVSPELSPRGRTGHDIRSFACILLVATLVLYYAF